MTKLERSIPYRDWCWETRVLWVFIALEAVLCITVTGQILLDWKIP